MATVIAEKSQAGTPVQMVINSNNTISVLSKKLNGHRRDRSHDVEEFYEVNPFMAEEIRQRKSPYEPMLPWLAAFVLQMWEECAEIDPWYIVEDEAEA